MFQHRFIARAVSTLAIAVTAGALSTTLNSLRAHAEVAAVPITLSIQPAAIVGGNQATATINLGTATNQDVEVALKSSNSEVARFGGISGPLGTTLFKIPKGSVSATVPIRTFGVATRTDVTLEAKVGADQATARLIVDPASVRTVTVEPAKIIGGFTAKGAITLNGLAPPNAGVTVQLSRVREAASRTGTADTSTTAPAASLPASVTIPPGASSATFPISTAPVSSDTSVTIAAANTVREAASRDGSVRSISDGTSNTATLSESATSGTATLTVLAPTLSKLLLNPGSVSGGNGSIGTVVLTGKAPSGGVSVSLSASSRDATVPPSISVPAGSDRADFKITTQNASSARSVTINAVVARNNLTQLDSTNNLKQIDVSDGTSNTIAVGESVASGVTANLTIRPTPPPFTIAVQPAQVTGSNPVSITLTVQPTANVYSLSNSVTLTSDHPELLPLPSSVPIAATVQISAKPQIVVVNATTNSASADQNVTITATGFSISASTTLLIKQTAVPTVSITATNDQANEEGPINGIVTVTRTGPLTSALTLFYSINDPSAPNNPHPATNGVDFEQLSGQVIIPAGASSATITVRPIDDNEQEPEERVVLQLLARPQAYTIQPGSSQATVRIKDHHKP